MGRNYKLDRRDIADTACVTGFICIGLLLIMAFLLLLLDPTSKGEIGGSMYENTVKCLAIAISFVLILSVAVLWWHACKWTIKNSHLHAPMFNWGLILFILIGPMFAAFILHFVRKGEKGSLLELEKDELQ